MRVVRRLALGAVTFALLGAVGARAATPPDTVVMAKEIDDIVSLDPAEAYELSGAEVIGNTYDRLLDYDAHAPGKIKPDLAQSWTVDSDGKIFTFVLRENARFATGRPVTAQDAAFSIRRAVIMDKAPAVVLNAIGLTKNNVEDSVVALDRQALEIKLPRALAPSFVYFCLTGLAASVVDQQTLMAHQANGDWGNQWLAGHWAGTGPYRLVIWRPNEYYALEANPDYWGPAPKTRRVIVRQVKDAETQRLMLVRGDIDYARNLDKDEIAALRTNPKIRFDKGIKSAITYLGLNQKNPNLRRPGVIAALKYLVDYDGIAHAILGPTAIVHQSFEPIDFMGAIADQPFGFDLAKAKALLAKAGLPDGFAVTMDVRNASPEPEIAQALQAGFAQAGVKVEIVPGDGKQVLTKYRARHHDIFLGEWEPDYPDPHSNAEGFIFNPDNSDGAAVRTPAWRNAWSDPPMMRDVAAALIERDDKIRARMYETLQRQFMRVAPYVMLFEQIEVAAHRADVAGFQIGVTSEFDRYAAIVKH
jgi:peptide/nickel transport system substrate-binding protein